MPFSDGGRAWFEAFEADGTLIAAAPGEARRMRSLAASVALLEAALAALVQRGGWRHEQLHLFGFADGATVRAPRGHVSARFACFPAPAGETHRGGQSVPPRRTAGATATLSVRRWRRRLRPRILENGEDSHLGDALQH